MHDEGRAPVLFVHGLGHGAWCWEHWQGAAAAAGYPAYAVSLRGHGGSSGPLRTALLRHYVDDVVATAAALPVLPAPGAVPQTVHEEQRRQPLVGGRVAFEHLQS